MTKMSLHSLKKARPSIKIPFISWFFIMPVNVGYVYLINCDLNRCTH